MIPLTAIVSLAKNFTGIVVFLQVNCHYLKAPFSFSNVKKVKRLIIDYFL